MTAQPTRTINQSKVQNLLALAADGCGGALNSLLVVLGDRFGLHASGQYSLDLEEPIVRSKATGIAQKRNSSNAPGDPGTPQWSAIHGEDRAISVQREETAFMTLIGHECAVATHCHTDAQRSSQG